LRVTAVPIGRGRANATEVVEVAGSGHHVHHRAGRRIRVPSRARRWNASRPRIRPIKPTVGRGPWRDGSSTRRARRASTSGRETRASWLAGGCWAGMCASRGPPRPDWRDAVPAGRHRCKTLLRRVRETVRTCDLARLRVQPGDRQPCHPAGHQVGKTSRRRRFGNDRKRGTVLRLPAGVACPQLWTSVWTFSAGPFHACDQG
jgi:hypothetical protein